MHGRRLSLLSIETPVERPQMGPVGIEPTRPVKGCGF